MKRISLFLTYEIREADNIHEKLPIDPFYCIELDKALGEALKRLGWRFYVKGYDDKKRIREIDFIKTVVKNGPEIKNNG